jgi:hypothetical protein
MSRTPPRSRRPDAGQPGGPLLPAIVVVAALVAIAGLASVRADGSADGFPPAAAQGR